MGLTGEPPPGRFQDRIGRLSVAQNVLISYR